MTSLEMDLQQAADVQTSPARLLELSRHHDAPVRRLVALNPNAPLAALSVLIAEFGVEVDRNPALLLHRMADPTWMPAIPPGDRHRVMRQRPLLLWLVSAMLEHEDDREVLLALASNPDCPAELHQPLCAGRHPFVLQSVVLAAVSPALLLGFASHPERLVRIALASNPHCPPAALEPLRRDPDIGVRAAALLHPASPGASTGGSELLVRSYSKRERVSMASDHDCPPVLSTALADDPEVDVRWQVVIHNRCSAGAMERLARDEDAELRRLLVAHRQCPAHLFEKLAHDPDSLVRQSVVRGVSCPFDVRLALVHDADPAVQQAALAQPDGFAQLAERLLGSDDECALWPVVLEHRNASAPVLDQLAKSPSPGVRRLVATSPRCSPETLRRLARDDDPAIRQAVAQNPSRKASTRRR